MSGKKTWMTKNMSENQWKSEQYYCYKLLLDIIPENMNVEMEYLVDNMKSVDGIKPKKAILDIAVISNDMKIAFRINGEIHEKVKQSMKDKDQKIILEGNGWKVYDLNKWDIPELWDNKKYSNIVARKALLREMKK